MVSSSFDCFEKLNTGQLDRILAFAKIVLILKILYAVAVSDFLSHSIYCVLLDVASFKNRLSAEN